MTKITKLLFGLNLNRFSFALRNKSYKRHIKKLQNEESIHNTYL
jgi:hypothetical protein